MFNKFSFKNQLLIINIFLLMTIVTDTSIVNAKF